MKAKVLRSAHAADAYLKAAQDALLYSDDPAHAVQAVATEVVRRAVDIIVADRAQRFERADDSGRPVWVDDLTYQVSYLADALALERTDVFAEYVVWSAATFKRRAIPLEQLVEELAAIDAALGRMPIRVQVRDAVEGHSTRCEHASESCCRRHSLCASGLARRGPRQHSRVD